MTGIPNPLDTQRHVDDLREYLAANIARLLPKGLRCKVQFVIDNGCILPSSVSIEFRGAPEAKTGGPSSRNGRFGR